MIGAHTSNLHQNYYGNVEKSRQRRSRDFAVLTYSMYAPRVKIAAVLLDGLFCPFPPVDDAGLPTTIYMESARSVQQPHYGKPVSCHN